MTTPTPDALALATAARLAKRVDPEGWARMFFGRPCRCVQSPQHPCHLPWCEKSARITPPTLAEAKAEWAAAGGDPERGPALSGRSEDGRVRWCSNEFGVSVHVGFLTATRRAGSMEWDFGGHGTSACLVELGRLAEAADGGAK